MCDTIVLGSGKIAVRNYQPSSQVRVPGFTGLMLWWEFTGTLRISEVRSGRAGLSGEVCLAWKPLPGCCSMWPH